MTLTLFSFGFLSWNLIMTRGDYRIVPYVHASVYALTSISTLLLKYLWPIYNFTKLTKE